MYNQNLYFYWIWKRFLISVQLGMAEVLKRFSLFCIKLSRGEICLIPIQ